MLLVKILLKLLFKFHSDYKNLLFKTVTLSLLIFFLFCWWHTNTTDNIHDDDDCFIYNSWTNNNNYTVLAVVRKYLTFVIILVTVTATTTTRLSSILTGVGVCWWTNPHHEIRQSLPSCVFLLYSSLKFVWRMIRDEVWTQWLEGDLPFQLATLTLMKCSLFCMFYEWLMKRILLTFFPASFWHFPRIFIKIHIHILQRPSSQPARR